MHINDSQTSFSLSGWTGHLFRAAAVRSRRAAGFAGAWREAREEVRRERAAAAVPRHLRDDVGVTASRG